MIGTRGVFGGYGTGVRFDVPVDPDAPEAQQWLREELAKAPYQAARPTWFDRLSEGFLDWLNSLTLGEGEGLEGWIPLVLTVLAIAALVVAFLIFGMPRLNRRRPVAETVFGKNDRRSAEEMRQAARKAAASRDWNLAVQEMYRAIARGLEERTVLKASPGTTAHDLAAQAGAIFPGEAARLADAAREDDGIGVGGRQRGARQGEQESEASYEGCSHGGLRASGGRPRPGSATLPDMTPPRRPLAHHPHDPAAVCKSAGDVRHTDRGACSATRHSHYPRAR